MKINLNMDGFSFFFLLLLLTSASCTCFLRLTKGADAVDGGYHLLGMKPTVLGIGECERNARRLELGGSAATGAHGNHVVALSEACLEAYVVARHVLHHESESGQEVEGVVHRGLTHPESVFHAIVHFVVGEQFACFVYQVEDGLAFGRVPHVVILDIACENEFHRGFYVDTVHQSSCKLNGFQVMLCAIDGGNWP